MNNREWLYGLDVADLSDWFDAEHVEPNDGIKPESVVKSQSVDANDGDSAQDMDNGVCVHKCPNESYRQDADQPKRDESPDCESDSREKLEAEIYEWCDYHSDELEIIAGWLDRQAAITERECKQREYAEGDVYSKVYTKSHIDEMIRDAKIELELQRDRNAELQEALDQQRAATANANDLWGRTRDELAAVKRERDNLADDLLASNREREHLRRTLGIALDHAHDVLTLVNLDGEVVS